MPVFATDSTRFSAAVKYEFDPSVGYTRELGVINDAAGTIKVGTVMGKVTATGKWKVCLSAAADGSQTPAGVFVADRLGLSQDLTVAANTDTPGLIMVRGPVLLADAGLTLGTGTTLAAVRTAFAALNPPMIVETAV